MMVIYRAICLITKKSYIGQTNNFKVRKNNHLSYAKRGKDSSKKFYRALRKYGEDKFRWEILQEFEDTKLANELETKWIKRFNSVEDGYNCLEKPLTHLRGKDHPNFNKKLSQHRINQMKERMTGSKNPMYNKTHTKETRKKISDANKAMAGRTWLGRNHSEETKKKLSCINTGKKRSIESCIKVSEATRTFSKYQVKKMFNLYRKGETITFIAGKVKRLPVTVSYALSGRAMYVKEDPNYKEYKRIIKARRRL